MTSRWTTGGRLVLAVGLFVMLGGPAPGSVGSCSDETEIADAVQFCVDRKSWSCQRRWARGELDDAERDACLVPIEDDCRGSAWGTDCIAPTTNQTEACIGALSDPGRLSTPEADLVECQRSTLCGGGR